MKFAMDSTNSRTLESGEGIFKEDLSDGEIYNPCPKNNLIDQLIETHT